MDIDDLRRLCLAFPGATEQIQWGGSLVFKVRGKMFAVTPLEPSAVWISFKASHEDFEELSERPGILPAPYLARAGWVAAESASILPTPELASLLRSSYDLVVAKLTRKLRESLASPQALKPRPPKARLRTKKSKPARKTRRK